MIEREELTAQEIREAVQEIAQKYLPFEANGYVSTSEMIVDVLLKAAAENISVDAVCRDLEECIGGNMLRELINEQLSAEQLREHEDEINAALSARLPGRMQKVGLEAAIDEHDEPFYGKTPEIQPYTVRSRARKGTTRFLRIVTVYVIYRQMRLTLAVAFVRAEDETLEVVSRLYERLETLNLRIRVLYMDRGFCSGAVISYLKEKKQPAVIACTIRGKTGGTRQLCRGRKSYRTPYTFTDGTSVETAVVAKLTPGKDKKRRRKWLLFVTIGLKWDPKTTCRHYRSRFGIESTYRILRRVRIKTSSRNPAFRFFVLGFALLLVNIWALLRWMVARIPGPGPHRVAPDHFQFHTFVSLLRRAIEQHRGVVMSVPFLAAPPKL
jgi:putative transposase